MVVTGAGDGIGAAFCEEFAKLGFKVVMISRTESKMEEVRKRCLGVETKIIKADFANKNSEKEYL